MSTGPLSLRDFRKVFAAQSVSLFGDAVAPIALAFAVLQSTGSATDLGILLAARTIPTVLLLLVGGVLGDRVARKHQMILSDLGCLAAQAAFAALLLTGYRDLFGLAALQALYGGASAFFKPASAGLLQELVPSGQRQRANAMLSGTRSTASIVGPATAGILVVAVGAPWALLLDAVSFGVSACLLSGVSTPGRPVGRPAQSVLRELREGYVAVRSQNWMFLSIIGFAVLQLTVLAPFDVLGPLVAQQHYGGPTVWAAVGVAAGTGALAGDAVGLRWKPDRPMLAANLVLLGVLPVLVCLALEPSRAVLVAAGGLYGLSMSLPNLYWFTALQDRVPPHLMGRVASFDWMGSMLLRPIGLAVIAPLAVAFGVGTLMFVTVVLTGTMFLVYLTLPAIRGLRRGPEPEAQGTAVNDLEGGPA